MVIIRQAQESDAEQMLHVASRFPIQSYLDSFGVSSLLADCTVCIIVAEVSGQVAGYLLGYDRHGHPLYTDAPTAEVEEIMVADEFRNRGVGRLLIQRFEDWARTRQCQRIIIGGAPAAGFYRSLGYGESRFCAGQALEKAL